MSLNFQNKQAASQHYQKSRLFPISKGTHTLFHCDWFLSHKLTLLHPHPEIRHGQRSTSNIRSSHSNERNQLQKTSDPVARKMSPSNRRDLASQRHQMGLAGEKEKAVWDWRMGEPRWLRYFFGDALVMFCICHGGSLLMRSWMLSFDCDSGCFEGVASMMFDVRNVYRILYNNFYLVHLH